MSAANFIRSQIDEAVVKITGEAVEVKQISAVRMSYCNNFSFQINLLI